MSHGTNNMIVRARAPLRLGLAGGGTDVSPFCDLYGGYTLNATINKYAYTIIETNSDNIVKFVAADQKKIWQGTSMRYIHPDKNLDLHKGVYNRIVRDFCDNNPLSLTITTFTDAPPGSGLGSSSTLVVSIIKAFVELLNLPLGEYEIAQLAFEIERIDLNLKGGKQDQYAATFGGFNFIEFYANNQVLVNPLRIKNWIISELEASIILYHTGVSRASTIIIDEQIKNVTDNKSESITAMQHLKQEAIIMKESLLRGDFNSLAKSMHTSWQFKKQMAKNISNQKIDTSYETAIKAGALAGKVSGAGGGGFMMFLVDPINRMNVIHALQALDGYILNCQFTKNGTQGWRVG
jgi:D-glycero-alpha-D-manno-heptose-7-phosphate kinase